MAKASSAERFQGAMRVRGFACEVVELPSSARTTPEAAQSVGCAVAQIAKSLVFRSTQSSRPILVIASGANRVNETLVGELVGEAIEKADAEFTRRYTGFAIGGVPPTCHTEPLQTFIDEDLLQYQEIWAAAGTPQAVFRLAPYDLERMTGGTVVSIK
ncbi:MAG: YbaK/EbsC family protein [Acidiferrobacterales bacterium]